MVSPRYLVVASIPSVEVEVKSRTVKVTGKKGTLTRDFKHINMDLYITDSEPDPETEETYKVIRLDLWFAFRKQLACVRTVCSHIENMFKGVQQGFEYKMRFVYSHFPINVTTVGNVVEIRNFLGERRVRKIELLEGVNYTRSANVKDEIVLSGIDIAKVSICCAKIQQATNIRNKDLRKFLDGI